MKKNLPFFKCETFDDGAWFRFGVLGGFTVRDRTKSNTPDLFSQRKGYSLKSFKIGKYTIRRLTP